MTPNATIRLLYLVRGRCCDFAAYCALQRVRVRSSLSVRMVTLSKFSELARGVQSPHKDENPGPDMKQVVRVQFACGQMDDDPLQQRTARQ